MSSILVTKLQPPILSSKRIARPYIIQRLNEGLESGQQLTLVSAPAGFGKTVCVSEWIERVDIPVTWLSLDPADDDPGRFFTYFVTALQNVAEDIGREIMGVLRAGQLPPTEIISTTLINDILAAGSPFLIVLDDFQVIQDDIILSVLEILLTNLPQSMHLVLVTREDPQLPLARLRANNKLTEIRSGDLRFTNAEAHHYLNDVLGLSLSQTDTNLLGERTEGWVAGLHLAGLSVRNQANPSSFIAKLSGSHRYILNYLTEEVLNQQPEEIQHFLLKTSILERLNGDLCNAITGRADSHAMLERLYNANLFLIPLDDEGKWYRYHQLFADLLRDRQATLQVGNEIELHQRASRWYSQTGMVSEAVEHALAGEDYASAVGLIESHAMDMIMQWHLKTVEAWMRSIPTEWSAGSPEANLAFAWVHLMRGDYQQATPYLGRLQVMFSSSQEGDYNPSLVAKWLSLQCMLLNAQGKPMESLQQAKRALRMVPQEDSLVRSMIYLELANAYQQLDEYQQSVEAFQVIIQIGQTEGNSVTELLGISGLALLAIQHGQYRFAFEITSQGIKRIEHSGSLPPISTAVYGELAVIHYQWHQLEQAHINFNRAIQVSTLSGYSDAKIYYGVILSRLLQMQGDLDAAVQELQKVVDLMQVEAPAAVREEVVSQQVRLYLAQDRLAEAERLLKSEGFSFREVFSFPDPAPNLDMNRSRGVLYNSALRILLHRAQAKLEMDSLKAGIELADHLIDGALKHQYVPFALEALLLRAQLHAALGQDQASQRDYLHALELGEPEGFISVFLEEGSTVIQALEDMRKQGQLGEVQPDYVENILFASGPKPSTKSKAAGAKTSLTEREMDVLRLMADGLKYEAIAESLYISLNTVRSHVKAIYGKLNVNNRTKAIEQAHKLGIL